METSFARRARESALGSLQRELVVGSLLGDAYLMPTTAGYCFRVNHGWYQKAYVDWKYSLLKQFVRTAPSWAGRCYYFRTVTHPDFVPMRMDFYDDELVSKKIPFELLYKELGGFGLAVWFMDDGSREGRQFRLNTQSFSLDDNLGLVEFLRAKFGIIATINRDKDRHRLRIASESVGRFRHLISGHVLPSMLYKLSPVTTSRTKREIAVTAQRGPNLRLL